MSEWISVEDELPDDTAPKLIFVRGIEGNDHEECKISNLNPAKTGFYVKYRAGRAIEEATHWKPLPEPPKE